jgi:hypothetical protein
MPGQEMVFTAKVRMQPVYYRGILGRYELFSWNTPVIYVHMRRLKLISNIHYGIKNFCIVLTQEFCSVLLCRFMRTNHSGCALLSR